MFLLDTNILSDLIRHPQGVIANRIAVVGEAEIATSIIVASELRYGAERRGSDRLTRQLEAVLSLVPVLPLGDDADMEYGRLRTDLEKRGQPIGGNDMLIAAHALSLGVTLVTDNVREFQRVTGLTIANWLRSS
ncbi:type II toxin-antitoxin system VapC family toxin [Sphingobium sp. SA2]|jgi:tRNA(fMet)-specific endonuclease VapC|uniref:type II toxin-antitoxin system VapC family toxin n=1 Tax=unclassified Sphingobium TaxID=2611147 RepID=UPI00056C1244|nr:MULTISPECIES: type II toxin-antitoxin system VapC family toxin [unclassified Sphingobium]MDT7531879.1 type II toxin-antitoxin system VapC family toxin [Sphingobium sp. SA2]|tara:strand:+ start:1483 stop:1884 length:402 start_codon:yes stop_codon:yes gene_type:complete